MSVQILRVVGRKGIKAGVVASVDGHTVEYRHDRDEWWCKVTGKGDCDLEHAECDRLHVDPVQALIHPAVFGWSGQS